jgi:hypothetical protein
MLPRGRDELADGLLEFGVGGVPAVDLAEGLLALLLLAERLPGEPAAVVDLASRLVSASRSGCASPVGRG